eukprot:COSAG01_NODE_7319_length_3253_cov_194.192137_1_plen_86_part_00
MEDDDSGSDDSGSEGGRDEHSSDESDDEEVGAMGTHVADEGAVPAVGEDGGVDVDYWSVSIPPYSPIRRLRPAAVAAELLNLVQL